MTTILFANTSGGGIRTHDLRVMSPTSYLAALPRDRFLKIIRYPLQAVKESRLDFTHSGVKARNDDLLS